MTIFNRMTDTSAEAPKGENAPTQTEGTFKLLFGTEEVQMAIKPGQTLNMVFKDKSEVLGLDFDRRMSFRDNSGNILNGEDVPAAGREYLAAVTHDSKGI
jgi:hypothetical protein